LFTRAQARPWGEQHTIDCIPNCLGGPGGSVPLMSWLIIGYAVLVALLIGCAGYVALFVADEKRREMAFRVLKLVWVTATGTSGVLAVALKLHDAGLIA